MFLFIAALFILVSVHQVDMLTTFLTPTFTLLGNTFLARIAELYALISVGMSVNNEF